MKDETLLWDVSAMHFITEAWSCKLYYQKLWFCKSDHVYSNKDNALKLIMMNYMTGIVYNVLEYSLRTTQYMTVLSRFVKSTVLSTSWTTSEKATWRRQSDKVTLLDALKRLEVARKYKCQFDIKDNIVIMYNKFENKLYRLKSWRKGKTNNIYLVVK